MAGKRWPVRGVAYTFRITGLWSQADPTTYKVNPALQVGDFKVMKDGGAWTNLTNLPTVLNTDTGVEVVLTLTEMTADEVIVRWVDAAGAEWISGDRTIFTVANGTDALSILGGVAQTGDSYALVNDGTIGLSALSGRIPTALVAGRMSSYLGATAAAVIDSGALATSATAAIADHVWRRNPVGGADGVAGTSRAGDAQAGGFFKFGITLGGTLTVFHADGVTAAATASIARYAAAVNAMQQGS